MSHRRKTANWDPMILEDWQGKSASSTALSATRSWAYSTRYALRRWSRRRCLLGSRALALPFGACRLPPSTRAYMRLLFGPYGDPTASGRHSCGRSAYALALDRVAALANGSRNGKCRTSAHLSGRWAGGSGDASPFGWSALCYLHPDRCNVL